LADATERLNQREGEAAMRRKNLTTLGRELRKRFRSPREALARLGIDADKVLRARDLAFDGAPMSAKIALGDLLAEKLSGAELQRARNLLHSIDATHEDGSYDPETAAGSEDEANELSASEREEIERRIEGFIEFLRDRLSGDPDVFDAIVTDDRFVPLLEREITDGMRRRKSNGRTRHHRCREIRFMAGLAEGFTRKKLATRRRTSAAP
jgi:hypothetical protein